MPLCAGVKVNAITDALREEACCESFWERVPGTDQPLAWARGLCWRLTDLQIHGLRCKQLQSFLITKIKDVQ